MARRSKVQSTHQVGNPVKKKKGKNGKHGTIVAAVAKAKYKVKWDGEGAASDTEHTNTSLLTAPPPPLPLTRPWGPPWMPMLRLSPTVARMMTATSSMPRVRRTTTR
jgi:hypothetical protein